MKLKSEMKEPQTTSLWRKIWFSSVQITLQRFGGTPMEELMHLTIKKAEKFIFAF